MGFSNTQFFETPYSLKLSLIVSLGGLKNWDSTAFMRTSTIFHLFEFFLVGHYNITLYYGKFRATLFGPGPLRNQGC